MNQKKFPYKRSFMKIDPILIMNNIKKLIKNDDRWLHKYYEINDFKNITPNMITEVSYPYKFSLPFINDNNEIEFNDPVYFLYENKNTDYNNYEIITDYFIEPSRMMASRTGNLSPLQEWNNNKNKFYQYLKNKKIKINDFNLREAIYKNTKEVSHEKVHFLAALFKLLNIKNKNLRIFDACAGWGDRYIASFIVDADIYIGVEPNENSRKGFQEMFDLFHGDDNHKIYEDYMPQFKIEGKFDICFLSPPSYTSEIYSKSEGQSIVLYPKRTEWTFNFLYATIDKCINLLDNNSFFIIQSILIPEINMYIQTKHSKLKFLGAISIQCSSTRNKPMWIWMKTKQKNNLQKIDNFSCNYNPIIYDILNNKKSDIIITSDKFKEYPNAKIWNDDLNLNEDFNKILFYKFDYKSNLKLLKHILKKYQTINPNKLILWNLKNNYLDDLNFELSKNKPNEFVFYISNRFSITKYIDICCNIIYAIEKLGNEKIIYCQINLYNGKLVDINLICPYINLFTDNIQIASMLV